MGKLALGDRVLFKIWSDRDTQAIGRIVAFNAAGWLVIEFNGEQYERHESTVDNSLSNWDTSRGHIVGGK